MNFLKPQNFLLPLVLVSLMGPGVSFLEPVFGYATRWASPAIFLIYLLLSRGALRVFSPTIALALLAYVGWCFMTLGWSEVPTLSLMKAVALTLMVFWGLSGGYHWVTHHERAEGLDFLWPYTILSLLAGLWGGFPEPIYETQEIVLLSGAAGGPNFLGVLMATSIPVILWRLYRDWANVRKRLLWLALLGAYVAFLYLSVSRAAYLLAFTIGSGFVVAMGLHRAVMAALASAFMLVLVVLVAPEFSDSMVQRNVYKQYGGDGEIFYTRQQPFEDSYDAAVLGGWIGVGYGVSAGADESDFVGGELTATSYGREKGNAQLAIVEETGVGGLVLYAILIAAILAELLVGFRATGKGEARVLLGVVIGTVVGLLLYSIFEAWWVAPGSPPFGYFWVMTGVGLGMAEAAKKSRVVARPGSIDARISPARTVPL